MIVLDRRCKSFGSSDRTGVDRCGSQSGSFANDVVIVELQWQLLVLFLGSL